MVCQIPEAETQQLRADFHNFMKTRVERPADKDDDGEFRFFQGE